MLSNKCGVFITRVFSWPNSDIFCSKYRILPSWAVTSAILNQPTFESLSNHFGSLIGLGDAPRTISAKFPNLHCSQVNLYCLEKLFAMY